MLRLARKTAVEEVWSDSDRQVAQHFPVPQLPPWFNHSPHNFSIEILDDLTEGAQLIGMETLAAPESGL